MSLDYIWLCWFCCWTCKHHRKINRKLYLPAVYLKQSFEDDDSSKLIRLHTGSRVGNALPVGMLVLPLEMPDQSFLKDSCLCYRYKSEGILKSKFHWLAPLRPVAIIPDFHKWKSESSPLCFTGWINDKLTDWSKVIRQPDWKGTCFLLAQVLMLHICFPSHLLSQWAQFVLHYREKDYTTIV